MQSGQGPERDPGRSPPSDSLKNLCLHNENAVPTRLMSEREANGALTEPEFIQTGGGCEEAAVPGLAELPETAREEFDFL